MKKIMKVVSLVLTFALLVSSMIVPSTTAFGAEHTDITPLTGEAKGKITLKPTTGYGSLKDKNFVAYRILYLTESGGADTYALPFDGDPTGMGTNTGNSVVRSDLITAINNAHALAKKTNPPSGTGHDDLDPTATLQNILAHLRNSDEDSIDDDVLANNAEIENVAKMMYKQITATDSSDVYTPLKVTFTPSGDNLVTDSIPFGYYLIYDESEASTDDGAQPVSAIITLNNDAAAGEEIVIKATKPTLEKNITNEDGSDADPANNASVGDTVYFKLETTVPNALGYINTETGASTYTFKITDTLSKGLVLLNDDDTPITAANDFNSKDITVKINGTSVSLFGASDGDITAKVVGDDSPTVNGTVATTIEIDMSLLARKVALGTLAYNVGDPIIITYKAQITKDAVGSFTELNDVNNTAKLTYSTDPNTTTSGEPVETTPEDKTKTYTYGLKIIKANGDATEYLADAVFILKNAAGHYAKVEKSGDNYVITGWTTAEEASSASKEEKELAGEIKSVATATGVIVSGFGDGSYTLIEKTTPAGYYDLNGSYEEGTGVNFEVTTTYDDPDKSAVKSVSFELDKAYNGVLGSGANKEFGGESVATNGYTDITILNSTREPLPETGGMGTTLLYVVGGALIVIAGVLLISKRRMHAAR